MVIVFSSALDLHFHSSGKERMPLVSILMINRKYFNFSVVLSGTEFNPKWITHPNTKQYTSSIRRLYTHDVSYYIWLSTKQKPMNKKQQWNDVEDKLSWLNMRNSIPSFQFGWFEWRERTKKVESKRNESLTTILLFKRILRMEGER